MIFLDRRHVLLIYVQEKHCVKTAKINFNKKKTNKQTNKNRNFEAIILSFRLALLVCSALYNKPKYSNNLILLR